MIRLRTASFIGLLGLALAAGAGAAMAQDTLPLKVWDKVRLTIRSPGPATYDGDVAGLTRDTLTLRSGSVGHWYLVPIPVRLIDKLEVSRGGERRLMKPAAAVLGVVGVVVGLALPETDDPPCGGFLDFNCSRRTAGEKRAVAALGGALVGVGGGLLIGLLIPTERWERVALPRPGVPRVAVVPLPGGRIGVGASLAL